MIGLNCNILATRNICKTKINENHSQAIGYWSAIGSATNLSIKLQPISWNTALLVTITAEQIRAALVLWLVLMWESRYGAVF